MSLKRLEAVVLRDNSVARDGLKAGHGLSMLLRTSVGSIIFDCGDSAETWENADTMGVDLTEVCCVALSHGHYDHTNGLPALLQRLGGAMVIGHPAIFEPRWADRREGEREYIGPPASRGELEAMGAMFELSADSVAVAPDVITTGEVPRVSELAPESPHLLVERDGRVTEDDFVDDLSLTARMEDGNVLLTGCAHAGLVNIVARATELTGRCPVAVAGGTHLARETEERIALVAEDIHERGVRQIVPMHCSGERGAELLEKHFAGETLRAGVGSTIVADAAGRIRVQ
jgi:7,8-dihydropterin-6-yl-methyl-4-(beta-D-ribofuranosyl)aminobenzene 5'-phosphate synthase